MSNEGEFLFAYHAANLYNKGMDSLFFIQFIGILALVMGFSMLLSKAMLLDIFRELAHNRVLSYLLGTLVFTYGLVIILNQPYFSDELSSYLILGLGWLFFLEGMLYLFGSKEFLKTYMLKVTNPHIYAGITLMYLLAGGYLITSLFLL